MVIGLVVVVEIIRVLAFVVVAVETDTIVDDVVQVGCGGGGNRGYDGRGGGGGEYGG